MPKMKLTFDMDDFHDRLAGKRALSGTDAYLALHKIAEDIFRPTRKHGYSDEKLNELLQSEHKDAIIDFVGRLETLFYETLIEYNIDLDDLE